ncbi:MAG: chemotaxis protein CheX [Lachnospiraceae bacterium]|nr:chemotaxis protein CheX [Lachnospiraceae bacterium]
MVSSIFGKYLTDKKIITSEQLKDALYEQKKARVKLGLIAVSEGLLDVSDAERINRAQALKDKRFGDIAVEMGLLTKEQIEQLLAKQGNAYMAFAQTLNDLELIRVEQLEQCLLDFKEETGFSDADMEALKSDDPDRILPLYLPTDADAYLGICGVAFRTLIRFADTDTYPEKAEFVSELPADHAAMQFADGKDTVSFGFAGSDGALLPLASGFAKDDFHEVSEDALDAVAEFVNCVTGLYASELSKTGVELELMPPEYAAGLTGITSGKMLALPLYVGGRRIYMMVSVNDKIRF